MLIAGARAFANEKFVNGFKILGLKSREAKEITRNCKYEETFSKYENWFKHTHSNKEGCVSMRVYVCVCVCVCVCVVSRR